MTLVPVCTICIFVKEFGENDELFNESLLFDKNQKQSVNFLKNPYAN